MLRFKLAIMLALFLLGAYLSFKLARRGISQRYEPRAKSPWSSLSDGEDPTIEEKSE
jgi:hypothetical protein